MDLNKVYTTKEFADALQKNQAYVLRTAKEKLEEGKHYRAAGARNYLFNEEGYQEMKRIFDLKNS